jgi:WD repeat-containing protein 35
MGKFDEAQGPYGPMDRLDLAIEMRRSIGDSQRVLEIMGSVGNGEPTAQVYTQVRDAYREQDELALAADSDFSAGSAEQLLKCCHLAGSMVGLRRSWRKFRRRRCSCRSSGGCLSQSVQQRPQSRHSRSAATLRQQLMHAHDSIIGSRRSSSQEIERRLTRCGNELIDNGQTAAAIDFHSRAGLGIELAMLLLREGEKMLKAGEEYSIAKMCFVFAGLQIRKERESAFDGGATAAERLGGLMKDEATTTSGLVDEVWERAEAVHFYPLTHWAMFTRRWMDALMCACRVFNGHGETSLWESARHPNCEHVANGRKIAGNCSLLKVFL